MLLASFTEWISSDVADLWWSNRKQVNRWVLSLVRKVPVFPEEWTSDGRLFQMTGAADVKRLVPVTARELAMLIFDNLTKKSMRLIFKKRNLYSPITVTLLDHVQKNKSWLMFYGNRTWHCVNWSVANCKTQMCRQQNEQMVLSCIL